MTRIKKLTPEVVARIAAGEVIERPMNIVKELVENSLDAESDEISITIKKGGLSLIKVKDNGAGIPYDDLEFAFELHTTSKLDEDEPSRVSTLGFRGEALSSIAAVSRVVCISKTENQEQSGKVVIEGGKLIDKSKVNSAKGTTVEIKGIFYNTPGRRKFLKKASTERKRITDLITNYSLMNPSVHFKLDEITSNGTMKNRLESPPRKNILSVVFDVLGPDIANELIPVEYQIDKWKISGYISKPQLTRSDRSLQFISVNERPIQHRGLQSTIEASYGSQLMRNTYPAVILKIDGPVDAIDFNVHPQKSEIRFEDADPIFQGLADAILESLSTHTDLPELHKNKISRIKQPDIKEDLTSDDTIKSDKSGKSLKKSNRSQHQKTFQKSLDNEVIFETTGKWDVLGHVMEKFGVIYHQEELWLIDVHAADERINFEKYAQKLNRNFSSQMFLQPINISLPEGEKQLLLDNKETLKKFGLRIEEGSNGIEINSMPVYYDQKITPESIKELLKDVLSFLNEENVEKGPIHTPMDKIEYAIVSRLACHGAIRSGYPISKNKIKEVLKELLKCQYPWTCAHGRPTVLRMAKSKIEGWFER